MAKRTITQRYRRWSRRVRFGKKLSAAALAIFWLFIFAVGSTLSSKPYRMWLNAADTITSREQNKNEDLLKERLAHLLKTHPESFTASTPHSKTESTIAVATDRDAGPNTKSETSLNDAPPLLLAILAEFKSSQSQTA